MKIKLSNLDPIQLTLSDGQIRLTVSSAFPDGKVVSFLNKEQTEELIAALQKLKNKLWKEGDSIWVEGKDGILVNPGQNNR